MGLYESVSLCRHRFVVSLEVARCWKQDHFMRHGCMYVALMSGHSLELFGFQRQHSKAMNTLKIMLAVLFCGQQEVLETEPPVWKHYTVVYRTLGQGGPLQSPAVLSPRPTLEEPWCSGDSTGQK